jgi:hypothetical protein
MRTDIAGAGAGAAAATAAAMMAERTDDAHNGRRCSRGIGSIGSIIPVIRVSRRRPLDFFFHVVPETGIAMIGGFSNAWDRQRRYKQHA